MRVLIYALGALLFITTTILAQTIPIPETLPTTSVTLVGTVRSSDHALNGAELKYTIMIEKPEKNPSDPIQFYAVSEMIAAPSVQHFWWIARQQWRAYKRFVCLERDGWYEQGLQITPDSPLVNINPMRPWWVLGRSAHVEAIKEVGEYDNATRVLHGIHNRTISLVGYGSHQHHSRNLVMISDSRAHEVSPPDSPWPRTVICDARLEMIFLPEGIPISALISVKLFDVPAIINYLGLPQVYSKETIKKMELMSYEVEFH